jgi:hypothetical protein
MVKEKQEKKKPAIIKRILKWIGLGLLTLLLIAAIFFQTPWKVITLLIIILLACTVLPKPARKWFWLTVGAVIVILVMWVFLPEEDEGWRPYTFEKELADLEAKYAIPDEENAARIYNQLLENYDSNTFEPNLPDLNTYYLIRSEPWSSNDYPEIAQWLQQHQDTIAKLLEASKIEKCRFAIVVNSIALGEHMKILAPMRKWAYLLVRAANNDLGDGRVDQALGKYIAVLQMAQHQYQQSTLVDLLVGMAIEALATRQFNRFVVTGDATEERLNVIEKAITNIKHDWSYDLSRILEGEKLMSKNFWGMYYEVNREGEIRLVHDIGAAMMRRLPEDMKDEIALMYWRRKLIKASTILCWFYMPSTPQKVSEIIDAKYEKFYAMAEPDFDWEKATEKPSPMLQLNYRYLVEHLTGILEPAYHRIHDLYLRITADKRGSQIIITLRRYRDKNGVWPQSLNDIKGDISEEILTDPINNSSFVYKPNEENFVSYSKGKNNIDEGGKRDKWDEEKTGADDWLIWPQKNRKTKEKKADAEQH